ncbi:GNAT family N-acetyltransferase [Patescibacteria group bacterium]|nr:GNAT family N-acetyltransferase [Patescibacteria group bacterium]
MKKDILINVSGDIQLRSWKSEWASDLFKLVQRNREHLLSWLPWIPGVKKVKDSGKFINDSLKEQKEGKGLEFGVWYKNKLVGCLGIIEFKKEHRRASIGCWIDSEHQGKGIMSKSLKKVIKYCFKNLGLNRIGYEAATKNKRSLALAERLGFTKEGIVREFEFVNNRFLNYVVFSLLKREWGS